MRLSKLAAFAVIALSASAPTAYAQWYAGGSLHRANGAQWKAATSANRLATSADFATKILGETRVQRMGSIEGVKPYARQLMGCVDETVGGAAGNALDIAEIAAMCATLLKWR
ncbi:MAG: hypothetical protein EOP84_00300 [Verrucomicrobiaceae bacterium]|nr:MAG: hypothetical protein EOP84_00300 [Verrucomicrobiaceae bacterium]